MAIPFPQKSEYKKVKTACSKFTCASGFTWQQNPRTGRNIDDEMFQEEERSQAKHVF